MNQVGEIRAERAQLLARAAVERERALEQLRAWEAPLALVDRGVAAARYIHRRPRWLIAVAIVFAVMRPQRALAWLRNGLIAWRAFRWVSAWPRGFTARQGRCPESHVGLTEAAKKAPAELGGSVAAFRKVAR